MKQAKVTVEFSGRPDGENAVRQLAVGDVISGDLAKVAVREGWAENYDGEMATTEKVDFHAMTVEKLKAYAEEHEIDLGDNTKKADIIAALELASEPKS